MLSSNRPLKKQDHNRHVRLQVVSVHSDKLFKQMINEVQKIGLSFQQFSAVGVSYDDSLTDV